MIKSKPDETKTPTLTHDVVKETVVTHSYCTEVTPSAVDQVETVDVVSETVKSDILSQVTDSKHIVDKLSLMETVIEATAEAANVKTEVTHETSVSYSEHIEADLSSTVK